MHYMRARDIEGELNSQKSDFSMMSVHLDATWSIVRLPADTYGDRDLSIFLNSGH